MEIRFFAGAAEAAGVDTMHIEADGLTADQVVSRLADDNPRLARVLSVSSLLADGARVADRGVSLSGTSRLDILPPFAGG